MTNLLGIVLFALGICLTVALHEAGHMLTARAFGMRVRRFFIGFGPTLWSFKKNKTEYGVAALPLGGFCDIAGMTAQDDFITEEERPYVMYEKPWWQRIIVLSGGVAVNLILGFLILFVVAQTAGLANPNADVRPVVDEVTCSADQLDNGELGECSGLGAGEAASIEVGDRILTLNGQEVGTFEQLREEVLVRPGETVTIGVERGAQVFELPVTLDSVQRIVGGEMVEAGAIGLAQKPLDIIEKHGFISAFPATWNYSMYMLNATVHGIAEFPSKIPGVVASIFGAERDVEGPMSVVGASRVGGELVEANLWAAFFMMLASLNYFLALFNLIPLPPFDGGHIAVVIYEKIRDFFRKIQSKAPAGPADYTKLMPVTYVIAAALMSVAAVIIVADFVNPIKLLG
ncbi:RIP metalloprotease [Corynebacterium sp.]|uniref:M50 family metallopeptidase n=1 Tax=Corynebacterium sp. TaxID=1720 RepID=UPI0026497D37|nr:site-2 protease family protein [Corynebacterium sp.]MDN6136262.1 site-2 protease family protein [Corynebacterium sp.]MDN6736670.1 site-2 protease family protein [Corynebacterium sp.]